MAKTDPKVKLLSEVPLFSACNPKELKRLAGLIDEIHIQAGETLMVEGQPGSEFYVVADGQVDVVLRKKKIASINRGGFFGEMALLDKGPRSATVVTTKPSIFYVLDRRSFHGFIRDTPTATVKILAGLAASLRKAQKSPTYS